MLDMYKGVVNSPETTITNDISNTDTIIYILDETRAPDELPNLMTLGTGTAAETIRVLSVNGNALTVERGFQGVAKTWNAGTVIARNFTEYDYNALKENIEELEETKETPAGAQAKADAAETNAKAYTDAHEQKAAPHSGHETPAGAQAKAEAAAGAVQAELDAHLADYASKFPDNAGAHNSIYRGKDLGTSVTAEQYANITNGTFKDMYIGDYWTINGTKYLIAAFNYYYNAGDSALTQNHVTLVPESNMYTHVMNDTDITDGGYIGSKMYTEGLDQAKNTILTDFSGHVVNHRKYLCNAVTDGEASAGAWFDSEVELMSEMMVYGSVVNGHAIYGLYNVGAEKSQLPLFSLRPDFINIRSTYWLQDVVSASHFAIVDSGGLASRSGASNSFGVRPAFSIS